MTDSTNKVSEDRNLDDSGVFRVGFFQRYQCTRCAGTIHSLHASQSSVYGGNYCPECLSAKKQERISDMISYTNGGSW